MPLTTTVPFVYFIVAGMVFSAPEYAFPLRRQAREVRAALATDAAALAFAWMGTALVIGGIESALHPFDALRPRWSAYPGVLLVGAYIVMSDLLRFVTHVAMHTKLLWPWHRFHHSVRALHWFSGNRASLFHIAMFMAPMGMFAWLLRIGPAGVITNALVMVTWNHLMHTNARIPYALQRAMEWVVTTPRYHHIHHSEDERHRMANLGSIFTAWDRICGIYVSPDRVDPAALRFGPERPGETLSWRAWVGL